MSMNTIGKTDAILLGLMLFAAPGYAIDEVQDQTALPQNSAPTAEANLEKKEGVPVTVPAATHEAPAAIPHAVPEVITAMPSKAEEEKKEKYTATKAKYDAFVEAARERSRPDLPEQNGPTADKFYDFYGPLEAQDRKWREETMQRLGVNWSGHEPETGYSGYSAVKNAELMLMSSQARRAQALALEAEEKEKVEKAEKKTTARAEFITQTAALVEEATAYSRPDLPQLSSESKRRNPDRIKALRTEFEKKDWEWLQEAKKRLKIDIGRYGEPSRGIDESAVRIRDEAVEKARQILRASEDRRIRDIIEVEDAAEKAKAEQEAAAAAAKAKAEQEAEVRAKAEAEHKKQQEQIDAEQKRRAKKDRKAQRNFGTQQRTGTKPRQQSQN